MLPPTFAMVHLLHRLYGVDAPACDDWYTNSFDCFDDWYSVPIVKHSQKQSKDSQNSKNDHVTCLHRVRRIHKVRVRVCRIHKAHRKTIVLVLTKK